MSGEDLRIAIQSLLASHPAITVSPVGHAAHAERYLTQNGLPIGFEPARVQFQNLWVRADSVRLHALKGLDFVPYPQAGFVESKPNHNLFGEPAFKNCDLVRFKVANLWQAVRVIKEVAGEGGAS